ncbi:MAG: type III-B CRISPR-associated protein Cas10/Cmr2 [Bacteroidia bacterium]
MTSFLPDSLWSTKVKAFLHDPLHKPLVLGTGFSHVEAAKLILEAAGVNLDPAKDEPIVVQADHIAAAADRNAYLGMQHLVYWKASEPLLTHPLGGKEGVALPEFFKKLAEKKEVVKTLSAKLGRDLKGYFQQDWRQRGFLWFWRFYFEEAARVLAEAEADEALKQAWRKYFPLFPADTRQPDHTLWQHLSVTAALSAALQPGYKPAFLIFGIGPVQEFISAARRTADFWVGSWLLSFLTWKAIEAIIEEAGPDSIIFPSLRGQPLFELWLSKNLPDYSLEETLRKNLRIASLPNRFVAILPYSEKGNAPLHAEKLAKKAEEEVKNAWHNLANSVKHYLQKLGFKASCLWDTQVKGFPEVYWIVFPWPDSSGGGGYNQTEEVWKRLFGNGVGMITPKPERYLGPHSKSPSFPLNWGNAYAELYTLADRFYGSRKVLRAVSFPTEAQEGEVSSLYPALLALSGDQQSAKEWWSQLSKQLSEKGLHLIQAEGRERLDALSTIKRFLPVLIREKRSNELPKELEAFSFPSNSEIAAVPFKRKLFEVLRERSDSKAAEAVKAFLDLLAQLGDLIGYKGLFYREEIALPAFQAYERADLARLEGSWLYEAHWEKGYLEREGIVLREEGRKAIQEALRRLYAELRASPSPYYAVLAMDGDHMGRWLSGTHERMPLLSEVIHPQVVDAIKKAEEDLQKKAPGERLRRPVTPAYHAFISEALGYFARTFVPQIVEGAHLGVVVYAGGDDVLAFLPAQTAIEAALKLRAAFSGFLRQNATDWEIEGQNQTGYIQTSTQLIPTMGPRATASVGIAFAHHRMPLQVALEEARAALKTAKEKYGRNALAVHVLKRSGEPIQAGLKWTQEPNGKVVFPAETFLAVCQKMQEEGFSPKLGRLFEREAGMLSDPEMARSLFSRLIQRRLPAPSAGLQKLLEEFFNLAWTAASPINAKQKDLTPVRGIAAWFEVAAFLQRNSV